MITVIFVVRIQMLSTVGERLFYNFYGNFKLDKLVFHAVFPWKQ